MPSGPVASAASCRPPTELLLCAVVTASTAAQVRPPSAEYETAIGAPPVPAGLYARKSAQAMYTRPKYGDAGFSSARMSSWSSNLWPVFGTELIGSLQRAPLSSEI